VCRLGRNTGGNGNDGRVQGVDADADEEVQPLTIAGDADADRDWAEAIETADDADEDISVSLWSCGVCVLFLAALCLDLRGHTLVCCRFRDDSGRSAQSL